MAGKYVTMLTNDNFEEIISNADKPVLVDFYADWCGPCQMLAPIIDEIAEELKDEAIVCKLNVDEARDIAVEFRVATIPTLMVFKNGENTEKTAYLLSVKNDYFVSDELKDAFNTALSTTENVTIGCGGGNSGSGRNSGGSSSGGGGNYLIPTSILVTKGESGGTLSVSVPEEYLDADYTFKLKLSNIHGDGAYFPDTYYCAGNGSSPYEDGAARFTLDDAPINVELINCEISDFESVGGVSGSLLLAGSINEVAPAVRINNNSDEKLRNVAVYMANYSDSHKLISLTKLTKDCIAVGATASFVFEKTDLTAAPETKLLVWKNDIKPLFVKINLPR